MTALDPAVPASGTRSRDRTKTVECLVRSLRDVAFARMVPDEDGGGGTIHVLATPGASAEELTREIESALLAYLDLCPDPGRISVAVPSGAPPSAPGRGAASEARSPSLDFVAYAIEGGRGPEVHVRVTLEVWGEHVQGTSSAEGLDELGPRPFADATLRAAQRALEPADAHASGALAELRVAGLEEVSVSGRRYLALSLAPLPGKAERAGGAVTGFAPIAAGIRKTAILATLDAARRAAWEAGKKTQRPYERRNREPFQIWSAAGGP